jgi:two-component system response regulator DesR
VIRLLLADDQALVRGALAALLDLEPDLQVVAEVGRGDEVVAAALEHGADVALLDVEMPGLDGFGAAEEIRRLRPQTDLFLHTGLFVDDQRRRAEQLNLRMFDKLELARTIQSLTQARRTRRPRVHADA